MTDGHSALQQCLTDLYGSLEYNVPIANPQLLRLVQRGSCRKFNDKPVDVTLIDTLCAVALAAPMV